MSDQTIRTLLESRLKTWADARPFPVAFENVSFTPPASTYLKCYVLRAETTSQDLAGTHRSRIGVFQISIVCQIGTGAGVAEGIASEIEALFQNNLRLTGVDGSVMQVVTPISIGSTIQDPDKYIIPVSLRYRSDTI